MAKTKSSSSQALDEFGRIKNRIYLGQLRTVKDVFEALGISVPRGYSATERITIPLYNRLVDDIKNPPKGLDDVYNTRDFLVESDYGPHLELVKATDKQLSIEVDEPQKYESKYPIPAANPRQKAVLKPKQLKCAKEMYYAIVDKGLRGGLLRVGTGKGKTFVLAQVIRWLHDSGWIKDHSISPYPVMYVTKNSVVEQTWRDVLDREFGLSKKEVFCINYDAMRSSFGEKFIEIKTVVIDGEEVETWTWTPFLAPVLVIFDESQALKNEGSRQHKLSISYSAITESYTVQIQSSATPFSKIASARCAVVSFRMPNRLGMAGSIITDKNFTNYAQAIATKGDPYLYSKAALKRLLKDIRPYIFTYDIKPEYPPKNGIALIDFRDPESQMRYQAAWDKYEEERQRIIRKPVPNGSFLLLAQLTVFKMAAELEKADIMADEAFDLISKGYSVGIACGYKPTIAKMVVRLIQKHGLSRDKISLIWGGDAALSGESRYSQEEIMDLFEQAMNGKRIPEDKLKAIIHQLKIQKTGLDSLPEEYRLGIQTKKDRQREIDRFQSGRSLICAYTFQAGGVGLSLHHHSKENNGGPRRGIFSVTWNEMEMDQALGRLPRLTSISETQQAIVAFKGTIEIKVLNRLNLKRHALSAVTEYDPENIPDNVADDFVNRTRGDRETAEDEDYEPEDVESEEVFQETERE